MTIAERQEAKETNVQSLSNSCHAGFVSAAMSGCVEPTHRQTDAVHDQPEWIKAAKQTELFARDESRASLGGCAAARTRKQPRARVTLPSQPEASEEMLDAADRLFGHLAKAAGLARDVRREVIAKAFHEQLSERRQREQALEKATSAAALADALRLRG